MQAPIYGTPVTTFQESWQFTPQVKLDFSEDADDVEEGYSPITAEIGFRLVGQTSETINRTQALALANKIKSTFASGNTFRWRKGRLKATYLDKQKGYDLRLLCSDSNEARRIITAVLSIKSDTLEEKLLQFNERAAPGLAFPVSGPALNIYGRFRRQPRKRPIGYVRFPRAELLVWGMNHPITLVDLTFRRAALA